MMNHVINFATFIAYPLTDTMFDYVPSRAWLFVIFYQLLLVSIRLIEIYFSATDETAVWEFVSTWLRAVCSWLDAGSRGRGVRWLGRGGRGGGWGRRWGERGEWWRWGGRRGTGDGDGQREGERPVTCQCRRPSQSMHYFAAHYLRRCLRQLLRNFQFNNFDFLLPEESSRWRCYFTKLE